MLEVYREAIALRRGHEALRRGGLRFLRAEPGEHLLVFERMSEHERLKITLNASDTPCELPPFGWKLET